MDRNRHLKKLFRSSKAGGIEPLLGADQTSSTTPSLTPTSTTPTTTSNSAYPSINSSFGPTSTAPIHDMHKRRHQQPSALQLQNSVTPFPMDVGRNDAPNANAAAAAAAARRPADTTPRDGSWEVRNVTLAEMAQMEKEADAAPYRRDAAGQYQATNRSRTGTGSSIENAWPVPGAPSPVSQPAFYLPPGAGPPSPQMRPSTPPSRMLQPGINNVPSLPPPQASFVEGESFPNARARGYSSASQTTRLSDHEGHVAAAPIPKLAKPAGPAAANRSPLASSYSEPVQGQVAGQYASWQSTPMGSERSTPRDDMERVEKVATPAPDSKPEKTEKEKEKKRFWNWGGDRKQKDKDKAPAKESARERESQAQRDAAQRERDAHQLRDRELAASLSSQQLPLPPTPLAAQMARVSIDESRASHDERPVPEVEPSNNGHPPSSIGHGASEDSRTTRNTSTPSHADGNDVGSAIHKLASSRETTHGAVLDVCERVNASKSGEAVGREAARTIRKILKNGTDAERRMALRIWWITMRNINVRGYRHYATNRKFMAAVEPIITQQLKPAPSTSTLKTCRDILSDLTFCHYKERGCEGLYELWKRVKQPNDPEFGRQLPDDYLKHGSSGAPPPPPAAQATPAPTPGATPVPSPPIPVQRPVDPSIGARLATTAPINPRAASPGAGYGPPYASLPDHHEDMRRLIEECTAGKESARVLAEALVYTSPEELEHKGVIKEFYTKCVLAFESLTNQMDWASSEAAKSRRMIEQIQQAGDAQVTTVEESALALLFEAHSMLNDSLKQYDDLEKMAIEERNLNAVMKAVQERSKKDTRMNRQQQMDMLMAGDNGAQASSSRSPSPALRTVGLPDERPERPDSKAADHVSDVPRTDSFVNNHLHNVTDERGLSRTPSPDNYRRSMQVPPAQAQQLPAPKKMASPTRTDSPLGRSRIPGPRPLPNPFRSANSSQNLAQGAAVEPNRGNGGAADGSVDGDGEEEIRPSRKALGKRRADPDNDFDPDEMFKTDKTDAASDHSITADDIYLSKPIVYAYDAWAESESARKEKSNEAAKCKEDSADKVAAVPNLPFVKEAPAVGPKSAARNGNGNGKAPAQNVEGHNLDTVAAR